ncbi:MAG: hypothetical protein AB1665_04085 [Candidatus Thermoplasmatota archaeon]
MDVEDQSLEILEGIASRIGVIGGWGVRAHLGDGHNRCTLDVDGVADKDTLAELRESFASMGLGEKPAEWGIKFFKKYVPRVDIPADAKIAVGGIELRIEISPPRIREHDTHHYFEFSLTEFEVREIRYHNIGRSIEVRVPPIEHMAAVKLGLPADYKHIHDAAMLLVKSDIDKVIQAIKSNDDWAEIVLRRMPKLKGRIKQPGSIENTLAIVAGLDIRRYIKTLELIEEKIS